MQAITTTHYEVLGISIRATAEEVHAAYRERLLHFRQMAGSAAAPDPTELDRLRDAFQTLANAVKRTEYDATLGADATDDGVDTGALAVDPPCSAKTEAVHGFEFVGEGGAYFRIWIVNLCLTVLTLGIYSAWAKVRREQYFHRHLRLDGAAFDYHGKPQAILKGRAIAFGLFLLLSLAQQLGPLAYGVVLAGLVLAAPALLIRALRFRATNTSYRGLRFGFVAGYGKALRTTLGNLLLTALTLGLWFPRLVRDWRKFTVDHSRFGTTAFACALTVGSVYRIFLMPLLAALGLGLLVGISGNLAPVAGGSIFIAAIYLLLPAYVAVRLSNAVWSSTRLGEHRFACDIPVGRYLGVAVTNMLGIVLTLGLFIPWAQVRMARLRAAHLTLIAAGSLAAFVAAEREQVSALGDGAADVFDMDLAL